ncbi:MAG: hypothetical protein LBC98_01925 [Prevotellaceae bacterium]|nr:hypothetical protein [Prevotellaceae bacterium]
MRKKVRTGVGEVLKTFGAKGELIIRFDAIAPESLDLKEPVFIVIDGLPVPFYFKTFEPFAGKVKVIFENMESEQLASELVGKRLHADNSIAEKPETEVSGFAALISFAVRDEKLGEIGIITDFFDYPKNPCFEVCKDEKQFLIPINEELIVGINDEDKTLITTLPEGLLEI